MGGENLGWSTLAKAAPNRGCALRIEIYKRCSAATQIVGDGQSNRKARLADPPFLG